MDVREAVQAAKEHIAKLYADEYIQHVGLEEVTFDSMQNSWNVTIGFFREWDTINSPLSTLAAAMSDSRKPGWKSRSFKVIQIDNSTEKIVSMTHRSPLVAE